MANKYCNLDGAKKIKDEYTKINVGFDLVETDVNNLDTKIDNVNSRVNTIITTPADSVSAQEIIDARKGEEVLGDKIDKIDNSINEVKDDLASHKADNKKHGLTTNLTIYVSPNGDDTLGDGTESKPYRTINRAINIIPKNLNDYKVIINVAEGVYPETVTISGFHGGSGDVDGSIQIIGGNSLLESENFIIDGQVVINSCALLVKIQGFKINQYLRSYNTAVYLRFCILDNDTTLGIDSWYTNMQILQCKISNKQYAIRASHGIVSVTLTEGANNNIGFQAGNPSGLINGIIIKNNNTLTATTLNAKYGGSQIFE